MELGSIDSQSNGGNVALSNRPFLSYNNFRKISLEKLEHENGQNENEEFCMENFQKGQHSICRVIRRFPDGRCWIEMGGHELLVGANNNPKNWEENYSTDGNGEEECAQNPLASNNHFFCANSHIKSCIFANHPMAPFNQRNQPSIGIGGYPERLPFPAFCRAFRCIHPKGDQSPPPHFEDREFARLILDAAQIAEHRYRLGLSQILLQREVLDELIGKRNFALSPTIIAFQANCRRHLAEKRLEKWQKEEESILGIQRNLEVWRNLKSSPWWKLFAQIRPLIPITSSDEKERLWREQMAQLELEMDELRSEMSRAQLELESTKKAKEMADKWGQELSEKNWEIQRELDELRGQIKMEAEEKGRHLRDKHKDLLEEVKRMEKSRQKAIREVVPTARWMQHGKGKDGAKMGPNGGELNLNGRNERIELVGGNGNVTNWKGRMDGDGIGQMVAAHFGGRIGGQQIMMAANRKRPMQQYSNISSRPSSSVQSNPVAAAPSSSAFGMPDRLLVRSFENRKINSNQELSDRKRAKLMKMAKMVAQKELNALMGNDSDEPHSSSTEIGHFSLNENNKSLPSAATVTALIRENTASEISTEMDGSDLFGLIQPKLEEILPEEEANNIFTNSQRQNDQEEIFGSPPPIAEEIEGEGEDCGWSLDGEGDEQGDLDMATTNLLMAAVMKTEEQNEEEKQMASNAADWETNTENEAMDLKRQLAGALDREHSAQQKAQRAIQQLKDAEAELEDLKAKNERMERRQKNTNDDLSNVREQLIEVLEQKEQLERKQLEANLKDSKRSEMQREMEARQTELEEIRLQNQRRIRQLETQLEEATAENIALMKQRNAQMKREGSQIGGLGAASMGGSMVDLAQSSSLLAANRALKRKLAKALSALQSSQQLAQERESNFDRQSQIRNLRQQIEEADAEKLAALRAQLAAENECSQIREELDNALSAKLAAEQKLMLAIREKNAATALTKEHDGQLQRALKREKSLVEFSRQDQMQMRSQFEQIAQLERELRELKAELTKVSTDSTEFGGENMVERQRLEMAELGLRECQTKLELEEAQRQRVEALLNKSKEDLDSMQQQMEEMGAAKEKEMEGQRRLRKENLGLQERINEGRRREAELQAAQRQLKIDCIKLEEEKRICGADLKLMGKRLEIVQNAFSADCLGGGGGSIGVGRTFSSICGGSELGDLEGMVLEEEGRGEERNAENGATDSVENFDGANSDTVEGSSSGGGENQI